jgi:hypothetical protein
MIHIMFVLTMTALGLLLTTLGAAEVPIRLHPANPHYFVYQSKPSVLITSAEHYSAC